MNLEAQKLALIQMILALQDGAMLEAISRMIKFQGEKQPAPNGASLPPDNAPKPYRQFGFAKEVITYVATDFDETPPGFEDYMPSEKQ